MGEDPGAPIDLALLPRHAEVVDGRLQVGGCEVGALAERFGTPTYLYDEQELRDRCREYRDAFEGLGPVAFAGKAFLCLAMARLVAEEGLLLDVASGGELHVALAAGFPVERLVFHGNNKSTAELRRALEVGVGRIVVDSTDELDRIEALVAEGRTPAPIVLRVTPGVEAHTHEHIATGAEDSKFGFGVASGAALAAARRVAASGLPLLGLHSHIGSQILALDGFAEAMDVVVELVAAIEVATGHRIEEINAGGGLGVAYTPADGDAPTPAEHARRLRTARDEACARHGLAHRPSVGVEPGRSIVARAGMTLYTVGTRKDQSGTVYVAVDGGMSDNPRPVLYGARYEAFLPTRVGEARELVATVAGKHCEQGDLLARSARLPASVAVGDVLATPVTGAYAYSMASGYNLLPRAAVVFVRDGDARLVVRREELADLVRRDVDGTD
jgi:diaminopimelate decarboxylase